MRKMNEDSSDEASDFDLTSFMFGNVDESGKLENDDLLEISSKKYLSSLSKIGFNKVMSEVKDSFEPQGCVENGYEDLNSINEKSSTAQDFFDIDELAEETTENIYQDSDSGYDGNNELNDKKIDESEQLIMPLDTNLSSKYENVDVTSLFPDFRVGKVLRFSRLFKPKKSSQLPNVWKNIKTKRQIKRQIDTIDDNSSYDSKGQILCLEYGLLPETKLIYSDDENKILQSVDNVTKQTSKNEDDSNNPAHWRFGPAKLWYDMLGVPENGEFDFGFKLKETKNEDDGDCSKNISYPEDAYLMVSQLHWEDDIIWNGEDIKHDVLQKLNSKTNAVDWVSNKTNRIAQTFSQPGKGFHSLAGGSVRSAISSINVSQSHNNVASKSNMNSKQLPINNTPDNTWYSIFPIENEDLVYGTWEDDIIWDATSMDKIPRPKILTLDPNDENIVLSIPDDVDPAKQILYNDYPVKKKNIHPHLKKSKLVLGKVGMLNVLKDDTPLPLSKSSDKDPFNMSNDCYYQPRSSEISYFKMSGGNIIRHSIPVVELQAPFILTYMGPMRLRNFHRPPMKRYSHGVVAQPIFHAVKPLLQNIKQQAELREQERVASGGGDVFFMRTPDDLTGRDGCIILVEYCEEYPPILNQVGMCSKIINYYKRKIGKDPGPPRLRFGEIAYAHSSPFLGVLSPGSTIQAIENNLYRAPLYEHKPLESDFLLIRTRHSYFIREIDALFTSGQLCPLYDVPVPKSKWVKHFVRNLLQVFIYRLFWKSNCYPKRVTIDDIIKAFPTQSEYSIRSCLRLCANSLKHKSVSKFWEIKPDFRLPTEEEIRAMVSPEQCCAYFSMLAAEQRLKDAGYTEKSIPTSLEDDEEMQLKLDDEIKAAPWNTTRAYIKSMKSKCLLELSGPADPTGCGEGFSYVQVPNKPTFTKDEQEAQSKRLLTGTDADLRRLSVNKAKDLLRKFSLPEEEIKKLSRWEVIDLVRTLSTAKAKAGEEGTLKFSRWNRCSIAEYHERYKEDCQQLFDLQNRVLSSHEVLSTDEEGSFDEEDCSEMGKDIEIMLSNKKTSTQLLLEKEERERHKLLKIKQKTDRKKIDVDGKQPSTIQPGRVLRIYRTLLGSDGKEYARTEVVRNPSVIDAYVKIRTSTDKGFIKQIIPKHDRLGRVIKSQQCETTNSLKPEPNFGYSLANKSNSLSNDVPMSNSGTVITPKSYTGVILPRPHKPKSVKIKPEPKVKCGVCGNAGHMRTNKDCPLYNLNPNASVNLTLSEEEEEKIDSQINLEDNNLLNVDGTKVTLSSKLLKYADEVKKKSLVLKIPKDALAQKKRKQEKLHCDYLNKPNRSSNRRCTDPLLALSDIFESILNEMRSMPEVHPFIYPVNIKNVPDYYNIVKRPMDLQTIKNGLHLKRYKNREEFLTDINQIVENSILYNGAMHSLTVAARRMLDVCVSRLHEKEERLMLLEKKINPLLDDNDQVALTFILDNVVRKVKSMSEAQIFMKSVDRKLVKDYYNVIKQPIDLEIISSRVSSHKYHHRKEFLKDMNLMLDNCVAYNGENSEFTRRARILINVANDSLKEFDQHLTQVEQNISLVQARTLNQVEINSAAKDDEYSDNQNMEDNPSLPKKYKLNNEVIEFQLDPNNKHLKTKTNHILEDDLYCSSDDDNDFIEVVDEILPNNDSQQMVQAMDLLGNMEYSSVCQNHNQIQVNESIDLDLNYGCSDIMLASYNLDNNDNKDLASSSQQDNKIDNIQDDLKVSDSDEETAKDNLFDNRLDFKNEECNYGELWF